MEMLRQHTLESWMERIPADRASCALNTYEAFAHINDSMINLHAKWLEQCTSDVTWRASVSLLNILMISTV